MTSPVRRLVRQPVSRPVRRLAGGLLAVALLAGSVAGCGGGSGAKKSSGTKPVASRLAAAKKKLDATSGVSIDLTSANLPKSVEGILSAHGVGTHQPGFTGEMKAIEHGLSLTVPIVAIDGKVYVKFGTWQTIDPSAFKAPDPADLMSPDHGLSTLLTDAQGAKAGSRKRQGSSVVTDVTATLPGSDVSSIIPSASDGTFDAVFTLTDSDTLTKAKITGPFYSGAKDVTYTFTFSKYGDKTTVKAP